MSKKTAAERRRKSAVARQREPRVTSFWHGGYPGLEPGTILIGSAEAKRQGDDPTRYKNQQLLDEPDLVDPEKVYFSSRREFATGFAAQVQIRDIDTGVTVRHGALYRVEPLGTVEPDPDFLGRGVSWCAPRARIVAVEDPDVGLDAYAANALVGPYMTWSDESPVYDARGAYLCSPEQIAAGQTMSRQAALMPWTPVAHINATLLGSSSGDRPSAEDHPAIALAADEASTVLIRHCDRAQALTGQGIEFLNPDTNAQAEFNDFLAPLELKDGDRRGVITAQHPVDGLVGACVITAAEIGGNTVMFVDRVVVDPQWRHRGLASVLLLTAQQLLPRPVQFTAGHCAPELGPFFAQMGYTVLRPGVPVLVPRFRNEEPEAMQLQNSDDCWFYRHGRA